MAKVLVTGASGFIGYHLVTALVAQGDDVTCLVRETSCVGSLLKAGVRIVKGDVTDGDSLVSPVHAKDIVYHLAGCTRSRDIRKFYRVNQRGVANITKACANQDTPPVLVTVSSLAAVGPALDRKPKTEADWRTPVSHYGHSKRAGERAAEAFADRVPISIVRPAIVLGEWDRVGLLLFRSIARFGVHIVPCWKDRRRFSVIHADDLSRLLILAAQNGKRLAAHTTNGEQGLQGYYFAASDEAPTYADIGRMVAEAVGRVHWGIIPAPSPIVWTVAYANEALSRMKQYLPFVNVDKAREITAGDWICSAQKAVSELGFQVGLPLLERLRQTAHWYRREGWL